MTIEIVPATRDLITEYWGTEPPWTVHAKVALLDGKPVGIGGIMFIGTDTWVFSEMKDVLRGRRRDIVQCVNALRPMLEQYKKVPLFAVAELRSGPLLMRLGFKPTGGMAKVALIAGGEQMGTLMVRP